MTPRTLQLIDGLGSAIAMHVIGRVLQVDAARGRDVGPSNLTTATIQAAVDHATAHDVIFVKPGTYNENVVIPTTKSGLTLICSGTLHGGDIVPDAGVPLTVHAHNVTIIGLDLEAPDGATALVVDGDRFRAYRCKIEGGAIGAKISPKTIAAGGHGGSDALFDDCEFAWTDTGLELVGTDYGSATQIRVRRCHFHNCALAGVGEATGSGGAIGVRFRNVVIEECTFDRLEDGTAPTKFLALNGDNANTGLVTRCSFAYATNEADVIALSTKVLFVGNFSEAGVTAARPS